MQTKLNSTVYVLPTNVKPLLLVGFMIDHSPGGLPKVRKGTKGNEEPPEAEASHSYRAKNYVQDEIQEAYLQINSVYKDVPVCLVDFNSRTGKLEHSRHAA